MIYCKGSVLVTAFFGDCVRVDVCMSALEDYLQIGEDLSNIVLQHLYEGL